MSDAQTLAGTPGPPSPWSALLRDNLNPDEVAGFLSNAIARKEQSLLTGSGHPAVAAAHSPLRRGSGVSVPVSTSSMAARLSEAAVRQSTDEARGGRAVPFSAERVRDRRRP